MYLKPTTFQCFPCYSSLLFSWHLFLRPKQMPASRSTLFFPPLSFLCASWSPHGLPSSFLPSPSPVPPGLLSVSTPLLLHFQPPDTPSTSPCLLVVPAVLCLASFSGSFSFSWKHLQLPVKLLLCLHPLPLLVLITGSILVSSFSSVICQVALYILHSRGHCIPDIWTETRQVWHLSFSIFLIVIPWCYSRPSH